MTTPSPNTQPPAEDVAALWLAYRQYTETAAAWQRAADELKARIIAATGDAEEIKVNGQAVATHRRDGQFATKRFATEQPGLAALFMRPVTKHELDTLSLSKAYPALYESYRARRFVAVAPKGGA